MTNVEKALYISNIFIICIMEIKFIRTLETDFKLNKSAWAIFANKRLPLILSLLLIGVLLLIPKETINDKPVAWGPMKYFGIVIIATGLLRISDFYRQKVSYFKPLWDKKMELAPSATKTEINITENSINVNELTVQVNYKWDFFKFYTVHKDYISIQRDFSPLSAFKISKNEVSTDELSNLLAFLEIKFHKK